MDYKENRMVGDYWIIRSMYVGDKEIVLGEDMESPPGKRYSCSLCQHSGPFLVHQDLVASDDYLEIVKIFGERIVAQAEKTKEEVSVEPEISNAPFTEADCTPISPMEDLLGKVIVIKADFLLREYRTATHQLKLCTGGFGAHSNDRGAAVFCKDLYSGKENRCERWGVLGIMPLEKLPDWAKEGLANIQKETRKQKDGGAR